jgi:hypothetical protein
MVWGYGRTGYGPFRTARVLEENAEAGAILQEAARQVRSNGGPAAFSWLADHRLRGLGVSFATKFLYFCGDTESQNRLWFWIGSYVHGSDEIRDGPQALTGEPPTTASM